MTAGDEKGGDGPQVNMKSKALDEKIGNAIVQAATEVADGKLFDQFPLVIWQVLSPSLSLPQPTPLPRESAERERRSGGRASWAVSWTPPQVLRGRRSGNAHALTHTTPAALVEASWGESILGNGSTLMKRLQRVRAGTPLHQLREGRRGWLCMHACTHSHHACCLCR